MSTKPLIDNALTLLGEEGFGGVTQTGSSKKNALYNLMQNQFQGVGIDNIDKICRNLVRQKLIDITSIDGGTFRIAITPAGAYRISENSLSDISLDRTQSWDSKWRMVSYDLPSYKKSERYQLTKHLKRLGLIRLHGSVWVTPYDCTEATAKIVEALGLQRYVSIFTVTDMDPKTVSRLNKHFFEIMQ